MNSRWWCCDEESRWQHLAENQLLGQSHFCNFSGIALNYLEIAIEHIMRCLKVKVRLVPALRMLRLRINSYPNIRGCLQHHRVVEILRVLIG